MKKEPQQSRQPDAFGLFPDLMTKLVGSRRSKARQKSPVRPPPLPDLSWLGNGLLPEEEQVKDIPSALVLMGEEGNDSTVSSVLQELGYRVEVADSPIEALAKLSSNSYATIIMHAAFGGETLSESTVYNHIQWLPVSRRRSIFYILVGPDFRTLYDLEALAMSANLVMNDADVAYLKPVLKKSFRDHEALFGPLVETVAGYESL